MRNAKEISQMLSGCAESVCMYLLPAGKKQGKRWFAGSVAGEPGNSLVVDLVGSKAGIWSDFKEPNHRGDMLELWQCVKQVSFVEALNDAKRYLGVSEPELNSSPKIFTRPPKPARKELQGGLLGYLTETRLIPLETLKKYNIRANETGEILFPISRSGELINIKYLTPRKAEGEKNKWRQEANAEPCLFGWQSVHNNHRSIVITEGEIDCLSVDSVNTNSELAVLSIPAGANNLEWLEYDYPNLDQFDDIILMLDMDEAGQKNTQEIAQRLGLERVRVTKLPKKDANEMLVAGMRNEIITAIKDAKHIGIPELKEPKDYAEKMKALFNGTLEEEKGSHLPFSRAHEAFKFRTSELTVWQGYNGHGKSLLLGYAVISLISQSEKVCLFSGEMPGHRTLERMHRQILGVRKPSDKGVDMATDYLQGGLWIYDKLGAESWKKLLEVFVYARKRFGITHFVIDSLMKCGISEDDYRGQKEFLDRLCDFKNEYKIHVHLIVHPRKGESEKSRPGKMDAKGTGAISDLADSVLTVWRNKIKEDGLRDTSKKIEEIEKLKDQPDAGLFCDKQRNGEWEGHIGLWINKESLQYFDNSHSANKTISWAKEINHEL